MHTVLKTIGVAGIALCLAAAPGQANSPETLLDQAFAMDQGPGTDKGTLGAMIQIFEQIVTEYPTSDLAVQVLLRQSVGSFDIAGVYSRFETAEEATTASCVQAQIATAPEQPIFVEVTVDPQGGVFGLPRMALPALPGVESRRAYAEMILGLDACSPMIEKGQTLTAFLETDGTLVLQPAGGAAPTSLAVLGSQTAPATNDQGGNTLSLIGQGAQPEAPATQTAGLGALPTFATPTTDAQPATQPSGGLQLIGQQPEPQQPAAQPQQPTQAGQGLQLIGQTQPAQPQQQTQGLQIVGQVQPAPAGQSLQLIGQAQPAQPQQQGATGQLALIGQPAPQAVGQQQNAGLQPIGQAPQAFPASAAPPPPPVFGVSSQETENALGLNRQDKRDVQARLLVAGFDPNGIDGVFGRGVRAAMVGWQQTVGAPATGFLDQAQHAYLRTLTEADLQAWLQEPANARQYSPPAAAPKKTTGKKKRRVKVCKRRVLGVPQDCRIVWR